MVARARVAGGLGEGEGGGEVAGGDGVEGLLEDRGLGAGFEAGPPEDAFEDDGEGGEEGEEDGPHDGAAFEEVIEDNVGECWMHGIPQK